jgi:heme/copper-type cytochrome/quinol oxidase subunit 2
LRISIQLTLVMAVIFAAVCFFVAYTGFSSLGSMTDPVQISDSKGFAWFWTALGIIALVFGGISLWILRSQGKPRA